LIRQRVAEVVIAMRDPHPKVAGAGSELLRQAGIRVRLGLMAEAAARLNEGFVSRVTRGRPFVRLKTAASLDGRTAMADGQSQWVTGPEARADVQRWRAASGAILTGIGTVVADDPALSVRDRSLTHLPPLRAVLDSRLRMPTSAVMLTLPGDAHVFCIDDGRRALLEAVGATVHRVAARDGQVDPAAVLHALAGLDINDVLVEAGARLSGALLAGGWVDELVIYQAPHIMGSETRGMFETPGWRKLEQRLALELVDVRRFGGDTRIIARPRVA
ncbi:MAG: bifunctional diaminohydroxyphosphoribosylaminopyrimidine deaminase/5-amino-6-(5-phosphoribosylamino)uracil reductase RibD, partial [Woeseiaceae bacterium]